MTTRNSCCILICQKHILMVRDRVSGKWSTPGGQKDPGESDFATMKREYFEETGMPLPYLKNYTKVLYGYTKHTAIYVCPDTFVDITKFRSNNEMDAICWAPISSLVRSNFSFFMKKGTMCEVRGVARDSFRVLHKQGLL